MNFSGWSILDIVLYSVLRQWLMFIISICTQWVKLPFLVHSFYLLVKEYYKWSKGFVKWGGEICSYLLPAESIIHLMLPGYGGANRCQKSRESYFAKTVQKPNNNLSFYKICKLYLSDINYIWQKMHLLFT